MFIMRMVGNVMNCDSSLESLPGKDAEHQKDKALHQKDKDPKGKGKAKSQGPEGKFVPHDCALRTSLTAIDC